MTDTPRLASAIADRYRIERELGQGGMATVYLAHDVRHDRKVALKVLLPALAAILGAERFLNEIRTTANLQHPHILSLFDSGQADGMVYYVMPYVAGESLRHRLDREQQLPVDEAVRIARDVAGALDYAHRQGVVHRDIKPENILLHEGQALVADFGIALAASRSEGSTRITETGMSLGTPQYMAPEQAMGQREITPKADIYALGCVLYELLSGEPPFTGPTPQAIVARVMTEEPRSLTLQRPTVPEHVEAAIFVALAKLPADRFGSAAQFAEALELGSAAARFAPRRGRGDRQARSGFAKGLRAGLLLLGGAALGIGAAWLAGRRPALAPLSARFELMLPRDARYANGAGANLAVSPDGRTIVYCGTGEQGRQLFARRLDDVRAAAIPGTEGAFLPFFSPEGRWLAFVAAGRLMKVPAGGGAALPIASVGSVTVSGASWGASGVIVLEDVFGLYRVDAGGGRLERIAVPDTLHGEQTYYWPEFLPDGQTVLFTLRRQGVDYPAALSLATRAITRFDMPGGHARYVEPYLVFVNPDGAVAAVPFNPRKLAITGPPMPLFDHVEVGPTGEAKLAISPSGVAAYMTGQSRQLGLVLVDRTGVPRLLTAERRPYLTPRISPDGRRIATTIVPGAGIGDIWVLDIAQGALQRLTFGDSASLPVWSPDGRHIAYAHLSGDAAGNYRDLYWITADGNGRPEPLLRDSTSKNPGAFTPDGRQLIYYQLTTGRPRDILSLPLDGTHRPIPVVASDANELAPALSPDGQFLAYVSDESGRSEVYVRPFRGGAGKWQVSPSGGDEPRWSPAGSELFYRSGDAMIAARYRGRPAFAVVARDTLFRRPYESYPAYARYDVTPDGRHFVMIEGSDPSRTLTVELNPFLRLRPEGAGRTP